MHRSILVATVVSTLLVSVATAQRQEERSEQEPFLLKTPGPAERLQTSPRHHEWIEIDAPGGRKVRTWVVFPEVDHPATAVIVIHENRGLTDWVRSVADQVAEAGYIAVAPDLLSGTAPGGGGTTEYESEDAARTGIGNLPPQQVIADLHAVFEHAQKMPAGNKVVAVAGFCWGGGQAFNFAAHNPHLAASFVFYGPAPQKEEELKNIRAPVYGFYGGNDFRITGQVPQVEKQMQQLGKKFEPLVYEGAGHGFMRQAEAAEASAADRKARHAAWERWKKLLAELKPSK